MANNIFDYLNSISYDKKDMTKNEDFDKEYLPFMINRSLSYFQDTVLQANEMNIWRNLPPKAQYIFLINMIRPRKRFSKWIKFKEDETIAMVSEYFGCNYQKSKDAIKILSSDDIKLIERKLDKGGKV